MAQDGVGNALKDEGERAAGDKAAALLDQAVQAYRSALEVFTKTDLPQDWAMTQTDLGMALEDEGERASGDKAAACSIRRCRRIAVRSKCAPRPICPRTGL